MLPSRRLLPLTSAAIAVVLGMRAVTLATTFDVVRDFPVDGASVLRAFGATASASVMSEARAAALDAPPPGNMPRAQSPANSVAPVQPAAPPPPPPPPSASTPQAAVTAPASDDTQDLAALKPHETDPDAVAESVAQREAAVAAAQARLTERVNELQALQTRLEGLEGDLKTHDEANWAGLVKLYEGMRPKDAATIFNSLEKPVLLGILDRMKPAKASPILASMDAEKARQVTSELADMRTRSVTASD